MMIITRINVSKKLQSLFELLFSSSIDRSMLLWRPFPHSFILIHFQLALRLLGWDADICDKNSCLGKTNHAGQVVVESSLIPLMIISKAKIQDMEGIPKQPKDWVADLSWLYHTHGIHPSPRCFGNAHFWNTMMACDLILYTDMNNLNMFWMVGLVNWSVFFKLFDSLKWFMSKKL